MPVTGNGRGRRTNSEQPAGAHNGSSGNWQREETAFDGRTLHRAVLITNPITWWLLAINLERRSEKGPFPVRASASLTSSFIRTGFREIPFLPGKNVRPRRGEAMIRRCPSISFNGPLYTSAKFPPSHLILCIPCVINKCVLRKTPHDERCFKVARAAIERIVCQTFWLVAGESRSDENDGQYRAGPEHWRGYRGRRGRPGERRTKGQDERDERDERGVRDERTHEAYDWQ